MIVTAGTLILLAPSWRTMWHAWLDKHNMLSWMKGGAMHSALLTFGVFALVGAASAVDLMA